LDLALLEPEGNLLLGVLDAVGAVADVAANVDGVVTADGTWCGGKRVGGTEEGTSGLDGITTFPDHSADGSAAHVLDESREEWLLSEILIMLLEVLFAGGQELDSSKLVPTGLESRDDGSNKTTLVVTYFDLRPFRR